MTGLPGDPIPGLYKLRLVKGGPYVAAKITWGPPLDPIDGTVLDRAPRWNAFLDGELIGEPGPCPHKSGAFRIWPAHSIDQAEYDYMIAISKWAKANAPNDPAANPTKPLDPLTTPIPF